MLSCDVEQIDAGSGYPIAIRAAPAWMREVDAHVWFAVHRGWREKGAAEETGLLYDFRDADRRPV